MAGLSLNTAPRSTLTRLTHTHVFMMDWLVANPGGSLKQLSEIIGFDRSWVSQVVNSDMFQAMYRKRLQEHGEEHFDEREAKLKAGAIEAVDCIREKLAQNPSERFVIDAAKTLLPAAGYSAPAVAKQEPQRHLHLHVGEDVLARSRERMRARFGTLVTEPEQVDAAEPSAVDLAEQMDLFEEVA